MHAIAKFSIFGADSSSQIPDVPRLPPEPWPLHLSPYRYTVNHYCREVSSEPRWEHTCFDCERTICSSAASLVPSLSVPLCERNALTWTVLAPGWLMQHLTDGVLVTCAISCDFRHDRRAPHVRPPPIGVHTRPHKSPTVGACETLARCWQGT